jgi:hypothetical protein
MIPVLKKILLLSALLVFTISGSIIIASLPRSVQYILVDNGSTIINDAIVH